MYKSLFGAKNLGGSVGTIYVLYISNNSLFRELGLVLGVLVIDSSPFGSSKTPRNGLPIAQQTYYLSTMTTR